MRFIEPCFPTTKPAPPTGPDWIHEIKFDGYRVQLHKEAKRVRIYSRRGADFSERYAPIAGALLKVPAKSLIIDGELVVLREDGTPDFHSLHLKKFDPAMLCVWCFDLLGHASRDMREMPLTVRKLKLGTILRGESFISAEKLFDMARKLKLEGIVSKRRNGTYHSARCDWVKVKTPEWKEANQIRGDLFGEERRSLDNIRR